MPATAHNANAQAFFQEILSPYRIRPVKAISHSIPALTTGYWIAAGML